MNTKYFHVLGYSVVWEQLTLRERRQEIAGALCGQSQGFGSWNWHANNKIKGHINRNKFCTRRQIYSDEKNGSLIKYLLYYYLNCQANSIVKPHWKKSSEAQDTQRYFTMDWIERQTILLYIGPKFTHINDPHWNTGSLFLRRAFRSKPHNTAIEPIAWASRFS